MGCSQSKSTLAAVEGSKHKHEPRHANSDPPANGSRPSHSSTASTEGTAQPSHSTSSTDGTAASAPCISHSSLSCSLTSDGSKSRSRLGLDKMISEKRDAESLAERVVHVEVPFGKPIGEVYDGVHDGPVLGSGKQGVVRLATHSATGIQYAVKCLDLRQVGSEELAQLYQEIYIMSQLDHPNIARLEEVYESESEIYLVQELCSGGELFDRLDEQPDYHYTEAQCARLVKQMLGSVRYIHSKGIIHRDLKLENFVFSDKDENSEMKLIDFGLSKHFKIGEIQHEGVGTPYTVAPEVILGSYCEKCDIWGIGVIAYLLLSGDAPFGGCAGESLVDVRNNILAGSFEFEPEEIWGDVSGQAKAFIKRLLVTDPRMRPTAREAQKDPWLIDAVARGGGGDDGMLSPSVVRSLVNFKEYSDIRKLLCEVLSFTLLPSQIQGLRREFEKMDTEGSGEISLSGLKDVLLGNAERGSLGALTEAEVEDIFNAMRVSDAESTIHWHEFVAAGLNQCEVDDKNLRLAFDRLDADHTGYITFENFMDLMGNGAVHSEEEMRQMWGAASMSADAHITYEVFLQLMKGQLAPSSAAGRTTMHSPSSATLPTAEEGADERGSTTGSARSIIAKSALGAAEACRASLSSNRELYRAHRTTRLAVLEASKRLEEEDQRRALEEMQKGSQQQPSPASVNKGVGLIMRHGGLIEHETIENFVGQQRREERRRVGEAKRRAGRRQRGGAGDMTVSDVRGLVKSADAVCAALTRPPSEDAADPSRPSSSSFDQADPPAPSNATRMPVQYRRRTCDPFEYGMKGSTGGGGDEDATRDSSFHRLVELGAGVPQDG